MAEAGKGKAKLRRLYVGGLPLNPANRVTAAELRRRFESFGAVLSVDIIESRAPGFEGTPRGFAYVDLRCTREQWNRCRAMYHGKVWREGRRLILEKAAREVREKRETKREAKREKKKKGKAVHADDMTPLSEDNFASRKGWKRGRYGRPVTVMHLRSLDGRPVVVDPAQFRDSLRKLFGSERPKTHSDLTWTVSDDDNDDGTGEEQRKENASTWARIVASASAEPFRLGLFAEDKPQAEEEAEERKPVEPLKVTAVERAPFDCSVLPQASSPDPLSPAELLSLHGEICANESLYRQDFRSRHKQANKLERRRQAAFRK